MNGSTTRNKDMAFSLLKKKAINTKETSSTTKNTEKVFTSLPMVTPIKMYGKTTEENQLLRSKMKTNIKLSLHSEKYIMQAESKF